MANALPLQIQSLGSYREQVLVLLHVAELRRADRAATPSQVYDTFVHLRLPPPANVSHYLRQLAGQRLVMQPGPGQWAATPAGTERIRALMGSIEEADLTRLTARDSEPVFAQARHHLLPPELAPAAFQAGIARFLERFPFDKNVFCITRFPRASDDPVGQAIDTSRTSCACFGLQLHLASDRSVEDLLFGNVAATAWACRYGIAIFENLSGRGMNYNVVLEVGAMLVTGRRCLLLKDRSAGELPTDLVGHIYSPLDISDSAAVAAAVTRWLKEDLRLSC